jgi:uncharacterized protein YcbK (DUF882 family)
VKYAIYFIGFIVIVALWKRLQLWAINATVTSWYRSPWHNLWVGGKLNSLHQIGWAFDVRGRDPTTVKRLRRKFKVVVVESDHTHVQII